MILLYSDLLIAACIPETQTENRDDLMYELPQKTLYTGCVSQTYPNERLMAYLYYKDGEPTGEGTRWFNNGQKASEVIFIDGKMAFKREWNEDGFLYTSEHYKDGGLLAPMEMPYKEAMDACQKATFDDYSKWKLPNIDELQRLPYSDTLKEMTYIASDTPKVNGNTKTVSYIRFGGSEAEGRWDNHLLEIDTPFNVLCVRSDDAKRYRLILGTDGIPDLDSDSEEYLAEKKKMEEENLPAEQVEENASSTPEVKDPYAQLLKTTAVPVKEEVEEVIPVTIRGSMHQKSLREGYFIIAYTYSLDIPTAEDMEKITLAGYRYTTMKTKSDGGEHNYTLIGPFSTTNQAGRELRRIQQRIEPNAYVVVNKH